MDEIDWIKSIKKVLILFTKVFIGAGLFFAILTLTSSNYDLEQKKLLLLIASFIGIGFPTILGLCFFIINIISKIFNRGRIIITLDKGYVRDLPKHCSPAISSLIYDLKIDVYKDYTATILYLCLKKYINLEKNNDTYNLIVTNKKDYSNLGRCEKYILDILNGKNSFDENIFKEEIIKEAQEKELLTTKKYSRIIQWFFVWIIGILLLIIMYKIHIIACTIYGSIIFPILYISNINHYANNIEYKRTEDGKNIALILKGLKRYIKDYTLIKDKEIDYMHILENYIPYALALGEANVVEDFIKYNEEYRDLIYNRKHI